MDGADSEEAKLHPVTISRRQEAGSLLKMFVNKNGIQIIKGFQSPVVPVVPKLVDRKTYMITNCALIILQVNKLAKETVADL